METVQHLWAICSDVWLPFWGRTFSFNPCASSLLFSLCPAIQIPTLFPGWLPIGMGVGAAGKFTQNNPTSVLTQPPCQGECSSPTLVISFGLAPIYWFYWPKTRANTQAVVCLPELFHTKNYSSCLSPLHNQRLEKFQSSASPKSLKWDKEAAYNPDHCSSGLMSTCCFGFFLVPSGCYYETVNFWKYRLLSIIGNKVLERPSENDSVAFLLSP